jgi:antitoxin component of RelBE/YafQ-DinJ toxin-antitoxin module
MAHIDTAVELHTKSLIIVKQLNLQVSLTEFLPFEISKLSNNKQYTQNEHNNKRMRKTQNTFKPTDVV